MITFAFYSIHYGTKILGLTDKLYSQSLENRINMLFLFTDLYLLLTMLFFFILLAVAMNFAIAYFLIIFTIHVIEYNLKKPIMGKNLNDLYQNKYYN